MAGRLAKTRQIVPPKWRFAEDVCHISEIGVLKLCGVSVSAESDVHRLVFGVWMSVSGESDSWADVFGSCLSVSAESDKHAPVLGFVCPFLQNRTHADWGMVG